MIKQVIKTLAKPLLKGKNFSLASDIQDPRAYAKLRGHFLGNSETVLEFGAMAPMLNALSFDAHVPKQIDFLSLDVDGAELEAIKGVDHQTFRFKSPLVECRDFTRFSDYLEKQGNRFVEKLFGQDTCLQIFS